jgi:hypothetical protein
VRAGPVPIPWDYLRSFLFPGKGEAMKEEKREKAFRELDWEDKVLIYKLKAVAHVLEHSDFTDIGAMEGELAGFGVMLNETIDQVVDRFVLPNEGRARP